MDMVVMAADMDVVMAMERGRLMPSQDTLAVDMEAMVDMVMEDMGATVMERDLLKLMRSQDTSVDMVVMVVMAMEDMDVVMAMERGRLMPSQDTAVDMAVMVVMAMEDMVIAVKFFPLFIVPPPPIDFFIGLKTKNMNKT